MWAWYIAWAWMGVMLWMILFGYIRPNRREWSIEAEPAVEWKVPRKAMCRTGQCGRCQNCHADRWSAVWRSLHEEDKQWVRQQYAWTMVWAGDPPPPEDSFAWEMLAAPSMTRWVMR